jgi:hypothetical protein
VLLSTLATRMHMVHAPSCPDGDLICPMHEEHSQQDELRFTMAELRAIVEHGFTDTLGLEVQLPMRLHDTRLRSPRLDGTPGTPEGINIHHRDETLLGLGDAWVQGRYGWTLGEVRLAARAGLTVPLGKTVRNPFALGDAGLEHQHIQFGAGTVQPLLGLLAERMGDVWGARAWGQAQLSLWENRHGFRAGHRLAAGVGGEARLAGALRASAGVDVLLERPERWDGRIQQEGNLGRTDVLVGGGLHWDVGGARLGLTLRVPVYTRLTVDHGQLEYPGLLNVSVGTVLGP